MALTYNLLLSKSNRPGAPKNLDVMKQQHAIDVINIAYANEKPSRDVAKDLFDLMDKIQKGSVNTFNVIDNNIYTDSSIRNKIVKIALGEVGTKEVPMGSNITKYHKQLGRPAEAWCADFVSWVLSTAGILIDITSGAYKTPYKGSPGAPAYYNYIINHSKISKRPRIGDIAILGSKAFGPISHIGIITKIINNDIEITQGNTHDMVATLTYSLNSKHANGADSFIDAIGNLVGD